MTDDLAPGEFLTDEDFERLEIEFDRMNRELAELVRNRHFAAGVPLHYIDVEEDPNMMITEYPDGSMTRTLLSGSSP